MELLDNGNLGHEKLTRRETSYYHWQRNHRIKSPGTSERTGRYADVQSERQRRESEAMGVALSDINQTISTAFGTAT